MRRDITWRQRRRLCAAALVLAVAGAVLSLAGSSWPGYLATCAALTLCRAVWVAP